ncbi:type VI secretion system protein TssA, partial [Pseudomonas juntendi]|nr:type VI secretion system protein TssA [Pseudomonas juntendi]MDH0508170.1 type VI secretion system protein TssA [Pseudomonas juntendi]MDH1045359.1 type VI secretion system protein TssA [Pseudomonas juntendi]
FFKQTEPQSPVPYLIERAIKWGNMPLEGWLSDVIKDSNVVDNIRDVLGTREPKP